MANVKALEKAFKAARKAWRADKEDKGLKKAWKAAKAAFEAAKEGGDTTPSKKRKADSDDTPVAKKAKTEGADLASLEAALKKARKAKKADASAENKKAFKAAKKALEDAKAAAAPAKEESSEEEEAEAEAPAAAEETPAAAPAADTGFAGLKRGGQQAAANQSDKPPSARMFMGNLSWNIDEAGLKDFFKDCGTLNDIYWAEDRDTGKFRGFAFITFDTVEMAIKAMELNGQSLLDREVRLDYTEPRPDRGGKGKGKGKGRKTELSEKPEGCTTVFCGGLTDDVDDDKMGALAKEAGCGEIKAIRWLTDRDTGNFKGCGFVEFWTTECVDAFVKKNGSEFMGRSLRLDYSAPRKPREW